VGHCRRPGGTGSSCLLVPVAIAALPPAAQLIIQNKSEPSTTRRTSSNSKEDIPRLRQTKVQPNLLQRHKTPTQLSQQFTIDLRHPPLRSTRLCTNPPSSSLTVRASVRFVFSQISQRVEQTAPALVGVFSSKSELQYQFPPHWVAIALQAAGQTAQDSSSGLSASRDSTEP